MVTYMLLGPGMEVRYYRDNKNRRPFEEWFLGLDSRASAKVNTAVKRMGMGNLSMLKSVKEGVHEYVIDSGPAYRVYVGIDGDKIIILLGGGTKKTQQKDIERARERWLDYKQRKSSDGINANI